MKTYFGVSVWLLSEVVGRMGCWLIISWWMTDMMVPSMAFIITNSFCVSDMLLTPFYLFPTGKVPEKLLQKPSGFRQMQKRQCLLENDRLSPAPAAFLRKSPTHDQQWYFLHGYETAWPACVWFTLARLFTESRGEEGSVVAEVEDAVIHLGEEHEWRNDVSDFILGDGRPWHEINLRMIIPAEGFQTAL